MAKNRKNTEKLIEERKKMVEDLSVFVIRGTTIEARVFLNRIVKFDNAIKYLRSRLGLPDFDTQGAMELIGRCNAVIESFKKLISDIDDFILKSKDNTKAVPDTGKDDGNKSPDAASTPRDLSELEIAKAKPENFIESEIFEAGSEK